MKRRPTQLELPIAPADNGPEDFAEWITHIRTRNLAELGDHAAELAQRCNSEVAFGHARAAEEGS